MWHFPLLKHIPPAGGVDEIPGNLVEKFNVLWNIRILL
jgi:hypothetical protein